MMTTTLNILRKEEYDYNEWSGGATSEILITPENADFFSGNYNLRISIATVELEASKFTKLPDTFRVLTVLEGNHQLKINNKDYQRIAPFHPISFKGDDRVKSKGKSVNFNVITKNETPFKVVVYPLEEGDIKTINNRNFQKVCLFLANGKVGIEGVVLHYHDSVILDQEVNVTALNKSTLIGVFF